MNFINELDTIQQSYQLLLFSYSICPLKMLLLLVNIIVISMKLKDEKKKRKTLRSLRITICVIVSYRSTYLRITLHMAHSTSNHFERITIFPFSFALNI